MRRSFALHVSLMLAAGCAATTPCPESPRTPEPATASASEAEIEPAVVLLVRHAEKASDDTIDPPLTEQGAQRAECLARMLGDLGVTALYATQFQRTKATLAPLAAALGREVTIIDAQDDAGWTRMLESLEPGARVVVAGHSNTLPGLVDAMGGQLSGLDDDGNIPHDDYDRMVHVIRRGAGPVTHYTTRYCGP